MGENGQNSTRDDLVAFEVKPETPALRFLVSLSDGRTIIEDARPHQVHAWFRLQEFLRHNPELSVTALRVQNGDNEFVVPSGRAGYAYGKKMIHVFQVGDIHCAGAGYLDGDVVRIAWLDPVSLLLREEEEQTPEVCGFKLIRNPRNG